MTALPDRAPPEIEPGVTLDDLTTVEDCDAALDRLTLAIPGIEAQLAAVPRSSPNQPADWRRRAEQSLRIKKLLLPRLQQRRAELARRDKGARHVAGQQSNRGRVEERRRVMVRTAWELYPSTMADVESAVRERRPELFKGEDSANG